MNDGFIISKWQGRMFAVRAKDVREVAEALWIGPGLNDPDVECCRIETYAGHTYFSEDTMDHLLMYIHNVEAEVPIDEGPANPQL